VIVAAALCPGPPLLVRELSGADPSAAILRDACGAAVAELVAADPDLVAVVGTADRTKEWPGIARPDLASYAPALPRPAVVAPLSVGLGAMLLDQIAYQGPIRLQTLDAAAPETLCKKIAEELDAAAPRVGLLVVADGSARRSLKAPGYFDPRAEQYDAAVQHAIATGDLGALRTLDPELARELMSSGWAALQVLAAAFVGDRPQTTVRYADAPFGVGYLVATIARSLAQAGDG
jgi:hypothetical protein